MGVLLRYNADTCGLSFCYALGHAVIGHAGSSRLGLATVRHIPTCSSSTSRRAAQHDTDVLVEGRSMHLRAACRCRPRDASAALPSARRGGATSIVQALDNRYAE